MAGQHSQTSPAEAGPEAFDELLRWLHPDREQAGILYEQIRIRLMKLFQCQGCPNYQELADETIERVSQKIAEGVDVQAPSPFIYFHGVARNVLREYWKSHEPKIEALDDLPAIQRAVYHPVLAEQEAREKQLKEIRLECLEHCLELLTTESRDLFVGYHQGALRERIENRDRLAQELHIPLSSLRLRIHRIREKLENCINKCVLRKSGNEK